jgi:hypothetical protein
MKIVPPPCRSLKSDFKDDFLKMILNFVVFE